MSSTEQYRPGLDVAVIGMSGRFPGANNLDSFLENLKQGKNCISYFTDEELEQYGISKELYQNPNYVKAKGVVENAEYFDSLFFGYTPAEAQVMDPQTRLMHECVWEAMETAGYAPETFEGNVGLYVGGTPNPLWETLTFFSEEHTVLNPFTKSLLNDKDLMATRIAYKLNLRGPSMAIFTSCSTSLVAIHMAAQALLSGECDIAIAGGVCISHPQKAGYLYQVGSHLSPDGMCKSFDADADGLVISDGIGVVVLKRVEEALQDGDTIDAVIIGTAINNDGRNKVGFTAPSADGQEEVIRLAQKIAGVQPQDVGYLETHGSGTALGDGIELEALKRIFPSSLAPYCAIGSSKVNIGHANSASGVGGVIRAILSLKHRLIFPHRNYRTPHAELQTAGNPFYITTELKEWKSVSQSRVAGVSSFGVGGTNAHIVLKNAPAYQSQPSGREQNTIILSAKTKGALERQEGNLLNFLQNHPDTNIGDLAYTLQLGRSAMQFRKAFAANSIEDVMTALAEKGTARGIWANEAMEQPKFVFMFPGQGKQYMGMGRELYDHEPIFRAALEQCLQIAQRITGIDYFEYLYPSSPSADWLAITERTDIAQPILFGFEYALATYLLQLGIQPYAMIGYSFGEFTAACLGGVFSLEQAVRLIILRGQLMEEYAIGTMLSVPLPEEEVKALLHDRLSIAVDNGESCIVSGTKADVEEFQVKLKGMKILSFPLSGNQAAHSTLLNEASTRFYEQVKQAKLNAPSIPMVSCVTGAWITEQEATSPEYWSDHIINTIRFTKAVKDLFKDKQIVFVELGPGRDLSNLVQRSIVESQQAYTVDLVRAESSHSSDMEFLYNRIAQLWTLGAQVNWESFYAAEKRMRIPLPTYPFEGQLYFFNKNIEDLNFKRSGKTGQKNEIDNWFYKPSWKRSTLSVVPAQLKSTMQEQLLFVNEHPFCKTITDELFEQGHRFVYVERGAEFEKISERHYRINPELADDYTQLILQITQDGIRPEQIMHMWSLPYHMSNLSKRDAFSEAQKRGLYSIVHLVKSLQKGKFDSTVKLMVVTNQMQEVTGDEELRPEYATLLGIVKVINQEYVNVECCSVDLNIRPESGMHDRKLAAHLIREFKHDFKELEVAYRSLHRWQKIYDLVGVPDVQPDMVPIQKNGVYLITGGLGRIGYELAKHLIEVYQAKIAVMTRGGSSGLSAEKMIKAETLSQLGGDDRFLLMQVDISVPNQVETAIHELESRWGAVNGIIHAAGLTGADTSFSMNDLTVMHFEEQFAPKVYGTYILEEVFRDKPLDFCLLLSSLSPILGGLGYGGYAAANSFLDLFIHQHNKTSSQPWISVNWETWEDVKKKENQGAYALGAHNAQLSMSRAEGIETFERILAWVQGDQIIVSSASIEDRIQRWVSFHSAQPMNWEEQIDSSAVQKRPQLVNLFVAPQDETEKKLCKIWEAVLGIKGIGVEDHFFELGGDSLKMLNAIGVIYQEFHIEVAVTDFFATPTIKYLATLLDRNERQEYAIIPQAPYREYYALSAAQKRIFYLQSLDKDDITYNETTVFMLTGQPDRNKLEQVFKSIIQRHEILRTSFEYQDNEPVQVVHQQADFEIHYAETAGGDIERDIKDFIRPFDLGKAPLIRVGLIRINENQHIMVFDMNHIVTDGVSEGILVNEFVSLYKDQPVPNLKIQYKDYAEWQNNTTMDKDLEGQKQFWLSKYAGEIPVINLPYDYVRSATLCFEGKSVGFLLDAPTTAALKTLAQKESVTLFMVIMAAYATFLHKISGDEDIVIGTSSSGRSHPELQHVIGMFVNTLAVRSFPKGMKSFEEFLQEIKEETLQIFKNQAYQFNDLVQQVVRKRDFSRNPLFDVMFVWQNMEIKDLEAKGLTFSSYEYHHRTSKFDLMLMGYEIQDQIYFKFEYSTHLFKPSTIERFIGFFERILHSIADNSAQQLLAMDIISTCEHETLLHEWNDTEVVLPVDQTIDRYFAEQAKRTPSKTAVIYRKDQITYRELHEKSNQLAHMLREKGVVQNMIVGLIMDQSIDLIIAILGVLKAGGAYLPINPLYPTARKKHMLEESQVGVVITGSLQNVSGIGSYDILLLDQVDLNLYERSDLSLERFKTDLCYVMYTSGSTGVPKGVMIEHKSVVRLVKHADYIHISENDNILQTSSQVFDASTFEYWGALTNGATLYLTDRSDILDPVQLERLVKECGITIMWMTSPLFNHMCQQNIHIFQNLQHLLMGGDVLSPAHIQRVKNEYPELNIINGYGPTENTTFSTCYSIGSLDGTSIPIGKPIANTKVFILDRYGKIQPIGIAGELHIAGDGLARGYVNSPELTSEKFIPNPVRTGELVYRTGDVARWLENGTIEYLGRLDSQVKISGYRIEPKEIEYRLMKHPEMNEVAVILKHRQSGEKYLSAYYAAKSQLGVEEVKQFLATELPSYMIPAEFVQLTELPLTGNGKVNVDLLPEPGEQSPDHLVRPRNPIEQKLTEIWAETLDKNQEQIDINQNFFDLGGSSLNIIQVGSKIRETFGVEISTAMLFQFTTIRQIGEHMRQEGTTSHTADSDEEVLSSIEQGRKRLKGRMQKLRG